MDYKKEIENLLAIAKNHGLTKRQVSVKLGKREEYITEGLSKGGNADMYNLLKLFVDGLNMAKGNVLNEPLPEYQVSISPERYISTLELYNKSLTDSMQSNLGTIQTAQQVLLSSMAENHKYLLMVLDTVKGDTQAILDLLSGSQTSEASKKGGPDLIPPSKGKRRA